MITYPLNNVEYTAEDAELFHTTRTSGIYAKDSFNYSISGADNVVVIGKGIGWIKNGDFAGKVIAQKEATSIDLGVADSVYPRIDAIVIQFDANSNNTKIIVKNGLASTKPIAPSVVRTEAIYELHLYHVMRNAGSVSITTSAITDLRLNSQYCGIMADSVTQIDTDAIWQQINAVISETKTATSNLVSDTEETVNGLIANTTERLGEIVSGVDETINDKVTSQLEAAKESGAFDGPQGPAGPQGPVGTTDFEQLANKPTTETWTFTLEDGSTVKKAVYVG